MTGTGNILDKINIDMNNKYIIIYCPNEKISTAEAYNTIKPKKGNYNLKEVLENENLENWNKYVKNDFEPYALKKIKGQKKLKIILLTEVQNLLVYQEVDHLFLEYLIE